MKKNIFDFENMSDKELVEKFGFDMQYYGQCIGTMQTVGPSHHERIQLLREEILRRCSFKPRALSRKLKVISL